jgi:GT2 family glycosyltransferase
MSESSGRARSRHSGVEPAVTIVVVPRERLNRAHACLESLYRNSDVPFRLVWVDGGSSARTARYLRAEARARGFELVRTEDYLSPNRARNMGLRRVTTRYVVFMDNDVVVAPGWLGALVACADETGAAVVGPLNCEGPPLHAIIHFAGGECRIREERVDGGVRRHMIDRIHRQGERVDEARGQLRRQPTTAAEFHCLMARTEIFDKIGAFDEGLLTVRENLDFCLAVTQMGGSIYVEPASVITYLGYEPIAWREIPFFLLRWNDAWTLRSLHRFRDKWELAEDEYFTRQYRNLQRWRTELFVVRPLFRHVPSALLRRVLQRLARPVVRSLGNRIVARYTRQQTRLRWPEHFVGARDPAVAPPA